MTPQVTSAPVGRLEFVQQLRGIASLIVVLGAHLLGVFWLNPAAVRLLIGVPSWQPPPVPQFIFWIQQFPAIGFGHLGVAVFFLISGFVIPFSVKSLGAGPFLIARAFRIYPVYWVGLACGLIALRVATSFWNTDWPYGLKHIALQALLVRDLFWLPSIDWISWTLEVEIKFYLMCALVAPVLIRGRLFMLLCCAFAIGTLYLWNDQSLNALERSIPGSAHFILNLQINGVMITFMLIGVVFHFHHVRAAATSACLGAAAILFALFVIGWNSSLLKPQVYGVYNYGAALAAFWLLYLRRHRPIRSRVLHFLGDISYPLYVLHPLVGYVGLAMALEAGFTPLEALGLVLPLVFMGAWILHRTVEQPSITIGHYLARAPDARRPREVSRPTRDMAARPGLLSLRTYAQGIWRARHFWTHLVGADLRAKYRRSYFGLLWSIVHPLALTTLLSLVMSRVFGSPILDYAPFIFSGLICWEFFTTAIMGGCTAFINSEGYIKQFPHPLVIYSLRSTLAALVNLSLGVIGMVIWVAFWRPANVPLAISFLPLVLLSYFLVAWPLATLTAFYGTRFRDLPQFLVILLQAIWYISPVFFEPKLFRNAGVGFLVDWNPVYHLLNLFRAPVVDGVSPSLTTWVWTVSTMVLLSFFAVTVVRKSERSLVLYL